MIHWILFIYPLFNRKTYIMDLSVSYWFFLWHFIVGVGAGDECTSYGSAQPPPIGEMLFYMNLKKIHIKQNIFFMQNDSFYTYDKNYYTVAHWFWSYKSTL